MPREVSITIIDDDEIAHYLVSVFLKRERPNVVIHSFLSGMEFLAALKEGNFQTDGILLDISMPKMTGWDLADRLKTTDFNVPVHILSSSADSRDIQRSENYAFVKGYIVKPLTVELLRKFLDTIIKIES